MDNIVEDDRDELSVVSVSYAGLDGEQFDEAINKMSEFSKVLGGALSSV
jgi:hypothetical protein